MRWLRDALLDIIETCLRVLPWPTEPRLIEVGKPGRDSPVLVTCNYDFTVRRVLRALHGQNAYLLVVPTRGINVWCAAAGGLFTAHQVISMLRASGIGDKVDHRRLILPQLSATGVERKLVELRTGWHIVFGPVYARDLPAYLMTERKTNEMRQVRFPLISRLEMAVAWAFPMSVICGLILAIGWRHLVFPFAVLAWGVAAALFAFFPWLHARIWPAHEKPGWTRYLIFFDPALRRYLLVWLAFVVGLCIYVYGWGHGDTWRVVGWSLAALFIVLLVSMDMAGSTPTYKSARCEAGGPRGGRWIPKRVRAGPCAGTFARRIATSSTPTSTRPSLPCPMHASSAERASCNAQKTPWHSPDSMASGYRPRSFAITNSTCLVDAPRRYLRKRETGITRSRCWTR
jgi:hypothetical protein